jgi:hypothetical protein
MIPTIFALLAIYQLKHFIADYPLQGKYMLGKFKPGFGFILPLLAHVSIHGLFTFLIALGFSRNMGFSSLLALFDMTIHFVMDRIKASPDLLGRFEALSKDDYVVLMTTHMAIIKGPQGEPCLSWVDDETKNRKLKSNVYFWWCLGLDQAVHHLTHYAVIYFLIMGRP